MPVEVILESESPDTVGRSPFARADGEIDGRRYACCTEYQADVVSVHQRIRLFVCANIEKITHFDTYQEIPDTCHF